MHFILLVYKYEYIMNKSSYFIDLADIFFLFYNVKEQILFLIIIIYWRYVF